MAEQRVLDLSRADVLAPPDDHLVAPAHDDEVALVVEETLVAGVQPAVGVDLAVGADVAAPDLVAADPHLAIGDPELDARHGPAAGLQPAPDSRVVGGDGGPVVVGSEHRDSGRRLGEPVGVHEVDVRQDPHRPLDDGDRHRSASIRERPQ